MSAFLAVGLGHAWCLARSRSHPGPPYKGPTRLPLYIPQKHASSLTPRLRIQDVRCRQAQAFQYFQPYQTKYSSVQQPNRLSSFIHFSLSLKRISPSLCGLAFLALSSLTRLASSSPSLYMTQSTTLISAPRSSHTMPRSRTSRLS